MTNPYAEEDFEDASEWEPGTCDRCMMSPGEVIEPFGVCCACSIGQGANAEDCECGPRDTDGSAS